MLQRIPSSTRTYTLVPVTTLFRSSVQSTARSRPAASATTTSSPIGVGSRSARRSRVAAMGSAPRERLLVERRLRLGRRIHAFDAGRHLTGGGGAGGDVVQQHRTALFAGPPRAVEKSVERRVGKECGSKCRSRGSPEP